MNPPKKLTSQQQAEAQQQALTPQTAEQQAALEFATAEELLRHDALHTPVPPAVGERLAESIKKEGPPARSWWQRLFGQ